MSCSILADAVAGDVDDVRQVALSGGRLTDTDLDGAVVEAHVWNDANPSVDLAGAVVSSSRKIISINLGTWLTNITVADEGEDFFVEYEVTFTDGRIWTWPSGQPDEIHVRPEGD